MLERLFLGSVLLGCSLLCVPSTAWVTGRFASRNEQRSSSTFLLCSSQTMISDNVKPKVVLVVGALGLDRLLTVPAYPLADAKIRTSAYHEIGGGNAANTASAMALLSQSSFMRDSNIQIKLCSKVGDDYIGKQLQEELKESGVDLSSPLFKIGTKGTSTGFTSIIVSDAEHTRTCIHTPGTCGELTSRDVDEVDLDEVFRNVVHFHSDARHTDVSLILAREAKRRGIPVSVDVEKDRNTKSLDALMEVADIVFTNSNQIDDYLSRLTVELEHSRHRKALRQLDIMAHGTELNEEEIELYVYTLRPSTYFTRFYRQKGKVVIITKGSQGSLHVLTDFVSEVDCEGPPTNRIELSVHDGYIQAEHSFTESCDDEVKRMSTARYTIREAGVLGDVNIVDTTGCGDAMIGGYLMASLVVPKGCLHVDACLMFGSWVAGRKLEGPGARSALPTGQRVDKELGTSVDEVLQTLRTVISSYRKESESSRGAWETVQSV